MLSSFIFTFAPIPLTQELSPLAHAAELARKRQAESFENIKPRHRVGPSTAKSTHSGSDPVMAA